MTTLLAQIGADLDSLYDATFGFAESVTVSGGTILGIFGNGYHQGDVGGSVIVSSSSPTLRTRDADALAQGASVTVRSIGYVVAEVQPDGYGETIHRLQFA